MIPMIISGVFMSLNVVLAGQAVLILAFIVKLMIAY